MNWKIKTIKSRKIKLICGILFVAERTGFEPAKPFRGLHAFQACLFNHSSTSPYFFKLQSGRGLNFGCKYTIIFLFTNP